MAERRRRAYGEGGIYQLADGRWQGSVELGWIDGARRRKTITRKTKSKVARELRRLLTEAEAGRLRYETPRTLEQWMQTYLSDVAATRVRPGTLHSYQQFARLYINPGLGHQRLDRIRPQHITGFYRDLARTLAPSSVRRVHAVLRRALTVAVRWGLTPRCWSTHPRYRTRRSARIPSRRPRHSLTSPPKTDSKHAGSSP
jgi:integrase